jgi:hypothetical protein
MGTVFSEQKSHGLCEYRPRRKVLERDTDTDIQKDREGRVRGIIAVVRNSTSCMQAGR